MVEKVGTLGCFLQVCVYTELYGKGVLSRKELNINFTIEPTLK